MWASISIALTCLLLAAGIHFWPTRGPRAAGALPQQIYVWQRHWRPQVGQGVERAAPLAAGFVVLGAEIRWPDGASRPPKVVRTDVDLAVLRRAGRPVGVALRIGAYPGPFTEDGGEPVGLLARLAAEINGKAAAAGVTVSEWQIDFDCAASKLEGYTRWVRALRARLPGARLVITALPNWLKRRAEFLALARATDGYVLQVHSLAPPGDAPGALTLCDPAAAREAVETAGRLGVPFSVALPTYTYVAGFNEDGSLLGLFAEGGVPAAAATGDGTHFRPLRADPDALAVLVRDWTRDRPAALRGVFWYRLPVDGDRLNWRWPTLAAAMTGRPPRSALETRLRWTEPERLAEIEIVNDGERDEEFPAAIRAQWPPAVGPALAADGLDGWTWTPDPAVGGGRWLRPPARQDTLLPAGEHRAIGWLRFERNAPDLRIQMVTNP